MAADLFIQRQHERHWIDAIFHVLGEQGLRIEIGLVQEILENGGQAR